MFRMSWFGPPTRSGLVGLAATLCACHSSPPPPPSTAPSAVEVPEVPDYAGEHTVFRGARVLTATGTILERGDVWIQGRLIRAVGVDLEVPADAKEIDARGRHITPGLVDAHAHVGVSPKPMIAAHRDTSEATAPVTAHVRARDSFWAQDPTLNRARAGGVTTFHVLPGSDNLVGGESFVAKTYPNAASVDDLLFPGAPAGLKVACGENPKATYAERGGPATRMGNLAGMRKALDAARHYANSHRPGDPRDEGLERLAAALRGRTLVHVHCYRADDMLAMLKLADAYGIRIRSFHHATDAYKIAPQLAAAGTAAAMWADWWGFKMEAFDAIRENAAMVSQAGAQAIIHSDSANAIQRLNQEAAKAMFAGQRAGIPVTEDEALRWITLHPAHAIGVQDRVGSLAPDKDADLVIWDRNPFSVYAHAEEVWIEGTRVYARRARPKHPRSDFELGLDPADYPAPTGVER